MFEDMKGDIVNIIVKCGDCVWSGSQLKLVYADGLCYCPACGREFNEFPPRSTDSAKADTKE